MANTLTPVTTAQLNEIAESAWIAELHAALEAAGHTPTVDNPPWHSWNGHRYEIRLRDTDFPKLVLLLQQDHFGLPRGGSLGYVAWFMLELGPRSFVPFLPKRIGECVLGVKELFSLIHPAFFVAHLDDYLKSGWSV